MDASTDHDADLVNVVAEAIGGPGDVHIRAGQPQMSGMWDGTPEAVPDAFFEWLDGVVETPHQPLDWDGS